MKTKVLFLSFLLVLFQFGVSYGNHYNLMVPSSLLKKYNTTVSGISKANPDVQFNEYQKKGNGDVQDAQSAAHNLNGYYISAIVLGALGVVFELTYIHYYYKRKKIGTPLSEVDAFGYERLLGAPFGFSIIFATLGYSYDYYIHHSQNSVSKLSNTSAILLKNHYPYPLRYDAVNSHCQTDSGQVIQGNDIYPAPTPLDADANNSSSNATALNANASKITPVNTVPSVITGKVKANGKLSPALKRDIKKNAYSIGAVMQAGKNGINCTLAYSADNGAGKAGYANDIKFMVNQSPSKLGKAGQLHVHVLPQGDLRGAPLLIQQPQAKPQTPQMLQQLTHPLKTAIHPFAKQKQDNNASQDKSKAGVAVISLSPTAN